jgi:hypothetical protein
MILVTQGGTCGAMLLEMLGSADHQPAMTYRAHNLYSIVKKHKFELFTEKDSKEDAVSRLMRYPITFQGMLKTIGQDLNLKGRENEDSVVHVD